MTDVNTDILRLGNDYYAVKRIESQNIDINEELKALYAKRHQTHVSMLNEGVVTEATEDWTKQIEHIRNFTNKGTFAIPSRLHGSMVMVFHEHLLELRLINYAPNRVRVSRNYAQNAGISDPIVSDSTNDGRFIVTVKPLFSTPLIIGYCKKTNQLYTPFQRTFHTFSGGNVCTGQNKASDFWALDNEALEIEINTINTFSPASRSICVKGCDYSMRQLVTPETFISIAQREEGVWNASR